MSVLSHLTSINYLTALVGVSLKSSSLISKPPRQYQEVAASYLVEPGIIPFTVYDFVSRGGVMIEDRGMSGVVGIYQAGTSLTPARALYAGAVALGMPVSSPFDTF